MRRDEPTGWYRVASASRVKARVEEGGLERVQWISPIDPNEAAWREQRGERVGIAICCFRTQPASLLALMGGLAGRELEPDDMEG